VYTQPPSFEPVFPAKQVTLGGPVEGEELGLFEDGLGGLLLFVWGIAVLPNLS